MLYLSQPNWRLQKYIQLFVFACHGLLFLLFVTIPYEKTSTQKPQSLVVRTVTLTPKSTPIQQPLIKKEPNKAKVAPEPLPEPQKELPRPTTVQKTIKKPEPQKKKLSQNKKPTVKKLSPQKSQKKSASSNEQEAKKSALIANALSSLNHIETMAQKRAANGATIQATKAPSKICTLSSESLPIATTEESASCSPKEKSYYDELVRRLKLSLHLPEYGEVKVALTINRSGKVTHVKCSTFKSKKNANYLEKTLPSVAFPTFGKNFPNEQEHTFRLRLCDDITAY